MRTTEPTQLAQGERIAWTLSLSYSATDYTLAYRFRGDASTAAGWTVDVDADGSNFDVTLTIGTSVAVGNYQYQAWLTEIADPTNTFIAREGRLKIVEGFGSTETGVFETRSTARQALDAIDAALASKASADQLEYEITTPAGSTRVKRMPITDLLKAREHYAVIVAREVARERARSTGKFARQILARLSE